jgi:hypothetical protein
MVVNFITGYLWITLGLFFLVFFGGKLFLQLLGVIIGFLFIFRGLRILSVDRIVYNYSMDYFQNNRFKK